MPEAEDSAKNSRFSVVNRLLAGWNMPPNEPNPRPAAPEKVPATLEEIREWLQTDKQRNREYAMFLTLTNPPTGDKGPSFEELIRSFLAKREEMRPVFVMGQKLLELKMEVDRFKQRQPPPEQMAECQRLTEEFTDLLLGMKEPYRTMLMRQLLPIREKIRKM
jgi:hypothetical protein